MAQLNNRADAEGMFDGVPVDISTELSVELTALGITKTADKAIWVSGELEYTIVVSNIDESDPGLPVESVTVRDTIDPTIATLVPNSVEIDGVAAVEGVDYTFNSATGLLVVPFASIPARGFHTITFRVEFV